MSRVANAFPGPGPPPTQVPYYHNNNNNYNPHQIHPSHHHVSAVGFHQYPQNDNRDQRFNQPHFDNQQQPNMIVDAPPLPPSGEFSPCGGGSSLRKRRSLSSSTTPDPSAAAADGCIAKLYVAPLPKTAKEDDVRQVFEKYGNVTEIILPRDKMSGERAAYCFVKYRKLEEGNAAIAALTDQYTFPGEMSPVQVRYAGAERERIGVSTVQIPDKLYVRCLNKQTTKTDVHEVFCRFGVIEDIYMAVDDMKVSRGFAFVQFSRKEMALAAIKGLNGVFTMRGSDQPLIVRFADPKRPRLGEPRSNFNASPAMQQFDPNWHPQPYPQWGNKEPAAPRVVDFASQPNHFPQQNAQAVSAFQTPMHQDFEKHQTASVETRSDGQKISSRSNAIHEDQNTEECDWSEHTCPDGNKYYFHCVTFESTWEKPEEYSMFERWFDEQIRLQDQNIAKSQDAIKNTQQDGSTLLQQQSLSTADEENISVYPSASGRKRGFIIVNNHLMAKIKPQALLQQSKKKKGPAPISITSIVIYTLAVLLVVFVLFSAYKRWTLRSEIPTHNGRSLLQDPAFPGVKKNTNLPWFATLDTGKGSVSIELFKDAAPNVVDEFINLSQDGYFKGFLFSRVVKHSVIQAGHSAQFDAVKDWVLQKNSLHTSLKHEEYMVGTPKAKNEQGGFEFFIVSSQITDLNEKLTVFGRVVKGQDVVKEIEEVEIDEHYQPKAPIEIMSVTLLQDM
ncbi:hypothetical protein HID58_052526 [Brassica napus]|uniref:Peptidylprolyl isomerase n=1 Tax=Brassica napus TaxID=3708 RepID=A0ABQ8AC20_BRANA|nr:hypothetical protein HID58_052526 [Brassica napus]